MTERSSNGITPPLHRLRFGDLPAAAITSAVCRARAFRPAATLLQAH